MNPKPLEPADHVRLLLDGRANLNLARNTGIVAVDPWSGGRQ